MGSLEKLKAMAALPTPSFWKDKRVFLTGHTGFKGAWMCEVLLRLGARVHGFSLELELLPSLFAELGLGNRIASHQVGDVRDADALSFAIKAIQPDVVFHMAAQPIVSVGYNDPAGTFSTNVMGTVNLLEAIRLNCGNIPVVVVSSDKCYDNIGMGHSFIEEDPLGGHDPYSASKAGTEIVCNSYRASFFSKNGSARLASVRAGNVVGGGDWSANRLLPDLIRGLSANKSVIIRNPSATRPWQHVLEPLYGYLLCAEAVSKERANSRPWNFGPHSDDVHTVEEVVKVIKSIWKGPKKIQINVSEPTFKEAQTLAVNPNAARRILGWQTRLDFLSTIEWTAEWYEAYYTNPQSVAEITHNQLDRYSAVLLSS